MSERKPRRWLRILLGSVAALLIVAGAAWVWLTAREEVPARSDYVLDLDELRRLADSMPGAKPVDVATELVVEASLPRGVVFAGESFAPHPMVHQVFQVRWADGSFAVIDSGMPRQVMERMGTGTFHDAAWAKIQAALKTAKFIMITHEHADHIGGLAYVEPADALAGRLVLTSEQLANTNGLDQAGIPEAVRKAARPLAFEHATAIAPGVVVQKAAGHTPGSILVYVRTEAGREYLFIGDVAWHLDQLRQLHYRPRLVTDLFIHEDRNAVLAEFRTLHDFMQAHPDVAVVVSHDQDERRKLVADGILIEGFASPSAEKG